MSQYSKLQSNSVVSREGLRDRLISSRQIFHEHLARLTAEDWKQPSRNPAWTVGQLMAHIIVTLDFYRSCIENARRGKATVPAIVPTWLVNRLNILNTRSKASQIRFDNAGEKYDQVHQSLLELLEIIGEEAWQLATRSPLSPGGHLSIEEAFKAPAAHLKEHLGQIPQFSPGP